MPCYLLALPPSASHLLGIYQIFIPPRRQLQGQSHACPLHPELEAQLDMQPWEALSDEDGQLLNAHFKGLSTLVCVDSFHLTSPTGSTQLILRETKMDVTVKVSIRKAHTHDIHSWSPFRAGHPRKKLLAVIKALG